MHSANVDTWRCSLGEDAAPLVAVDHGMLASQVAVDLVAQQWVQLAHRQSKVLHIFLSGKGMDFDQGLVVAEGVGGVVGDFVGVFRRRLVGVHLAPDRLRRKLEALSRIEAP